VGPPQRWSNGIQPCDRLIGSCNDLTQSTHDAEPKTEPGGAPPSGIISFAFASRAVFHLEHGGYEVLAAKYIGRHNQRMGTGRSRSTTPDLFSTASDREPSSLSENPPKRAPSIISATALASSPRHVLPTDLPNAIKQLEDQDLDRLLAVALAEQNRRGRKPPVSDERKRRIEAVAVPLTNSKMNAVRAAFKAGVKPSQIARQFRVSQSDVRKALASHEQKR
jgi:hypothetical protein